MDTCNSREYIGPTVGYVKSGMNVTAIPQLYVGQANTFSVTTTLSIVDQIRWLFGASQSEVIVNSSSSSYSFTYTYSGKFDLTIKACIRASSVCDIVTLPVRVQVPRQNMTTYITGRTPASISGGIADFYATFKQGYDFEYFWQIEDSSSVKTWSKLQLPFIIKDFHLCLDYLPNGKIDTILDSSKLRAFTGYRLSLAQIVKFACEKIENIIRKCKSSGYQYLLLFYTMFSKVVFPRFIKGLSFYHMILTFNDP